MADVQTRESPPVNTNAGSDPIGRVNVYDADPTPPATLDSRTTYATEPAPVTRSSPALMTWLLILVAVILALYFVVQFLT
jgi:hypothetical protein